MAIFSYTLRIAMFASIGTFLFVSQRKWKALITFLLIVNNQGFDTGIATTSTWNPTRSKYNWHAVISNCSPQFRGLYAQSIKWSYWSCMFKLQQKWKPAHSSYTNLQVVAVYIAGEALGAIMQIFIGDKLGRIRFMQLLSVIVSIGVIIQTASVNIGMFLAGRVLAGMAVGCVRILLSCPIP